MFLCLHVKLHLSFGTRCHTGAGDTFSCWSLQDRASLKCFSFLLVPLRVATAHHPFRSLSSASISLTPTAFMSFFFQYCTSITFLSGVPLTPTNIVTSSPLNVSTPSMSVLRTLTKLLGTPRALFCCQLQSRPNCAVGRSA